MTDYKNLKLRASSNPHIRNGEDTRGLMLDVIIALMPALLFGVWHFGVRVAISAVVSVASAIFFEWLYRKLLHKPQMIGDLSAAVTGLLLSMVCPPELPVWMLVVGNFFAIFVVKQLYGGLGKTFLMHAMAKRLLDRGLNVLMLSAYRFLDLARKAYFSHDGGEMDTLMETDVLMLDDLGSEPLMENITIVQLFNLINERQTAGRGTVLSTNLTVGELQARYTERIVSRLMDPRQCTLLQFMGSDIRRRKA